MEIDITHMLEDADEMSMLSASNAELGQNAGKITWNNSKAYAESHPLLPDDDSREEARRWIKRFGAWDADEIASWDNNELNALVVQFIAGDIREFENLTNGDWSEYKKLAEQGTVSGRIFQGTDGKVYFYLGE